MATSGSAAAQGVLAFAAPMPRRTIFWLATAAAVLAAVWQTWALRWTCDDAYISFRYAQHFAEGHGLVYNLDPQEAPVEGYTNFSWTMFLALGHVLGFAGDGLETWSIAGGILCQAGTVLLLALMAFCASGGRAVLPLSACGYAAIHHAASLAPAGLETALFVLVATAMLRLCLALRCARQAWLLGFLGVLAATTRPDGALLCAIAGGFVLFDALRRKAPRLVLGYGAPFVLVFVPYLLWRHAYYGYWVPNTFYAKSGGDPFVEQGFVYLRDFFVCYWPLLAAVVPLPIYLAKKPDLLASISPFLGRRPWLAVAAFVLPYLGFVAWVGGDFMFGRFVLPVLPALLFGLDLLCLRWRAPWLPPVLALWLVGGLQLRVEPADLGDFTARVSDNRRISVVPYGDTTLIEAFRLIGHALAKEFDGLAVRIGIGGAQANLAYRAKVPVAIECASGLTDAYIAHLPAPARGKAGHEKGPWLYPGYLERRGVHFMFEGAWEKDDAWREVKFFNTVPARLVRYEPKMIAELRQRDPGFVCVDFERLLDDYLATIADKPKEQVASDFAKFRRVWFDHQDDPVRLAKFTARLAQ